MCIGFCCEGNGLTKTAVEQISGSLKVSKNKKDAHSVSTENLPSDR
jgi:hypothetical protein